MGENRVEARVREMAEPVDVIGEPGESSGQRGRQHVDPLRGIDDRAHSRREFADMLERDVGDEQKPSGRRCIVVRGQGSGSCVVAAHRALAFAVCTSPICSFRYGAR
jgi:hypothetical protein